MTCVHSCTTLLSNTLLSDFPKSDFAVDYVRILLKASSINLTWIWVKMKEVIFDVIKGNYSSIFFLYIIISYHYAVDRSEAV